MEKELLEFLAANNYEDAAIIANKYESSTLLRALEKFNELTAELRYSTSPRLLLEATIVKISDARADLNVDGLLTRITMLESKNAELLSKIEKIESGAVAINLNSKDNGRIKSMPEIVPDDMGGDSRRIWARFVKYVREVGMFALYESALPVDSTEIEGDVFSVVVKTNSEYSVLSSPQNVAEINKILTILTGVEYKFKCKLPDGITDVQSGDIDRLKSLISGDKLNIIK